MKTLKNLIIAVSIALFAVTAQARCTTNDSWRGPDKQKHLAVGVAIGTVGTLVFKDPKKAVLIGVAVAAAKEVYDSTGRGTCSFQDFAVTAIGATAAAYGTAWIVTPRYIGYRIEY